MKMVEKLALQKSLGGIVLFKDGVFLRANNEPSYILTRLLKQDLKIKCYQVKQYNQWVTMCAFPYTKLRERLPKAIKTHFGCQLVGNFDLSGYQTWFNQTCHQACIASMAATTREKDAQADFTRPAEQNATIEDNLTDITITLTKQQFMHLLNWQPGYYASTVEDKFMQYLKHQAISICAANMIRDNE